MFIDQMSGIPPCSHASEQHGVHPASVAVGHTNPTKTSKIPEPQRIPKNSVSEPTDGDTNNP